MSRENSIVKPSIAETELHRLRNELEFVKNKLILIKQVYQDELDQKIEYINYLQEHLKKSSQINAQQYCSFKEYLHSAYITINPKIKQLLMEEIQVAQQNLFSLLRANKSPVFTQKIKEWLKLLAPLYRNISNCELVKKKIFHYATFTLEVLKQDISQMPNNPREHIFTSYRSVSSFKFPSSTLAGTPQEAPEVKATKPFRPRSYSY